MTLDDASLLLDYDIADGSKIFLIRHTAIVEATPDNMAKAIREGNDPLLDKLLKKNGDPNAEFNDDEIE